MARKNPFRGLSPNSRALGHAQGRTALPFIPAVLAKLRGSLPYLKGGLLLALLFTLPVLPVSCNARSPYFPTEGGMAGLPLLQPRSTQALPAVTVVPPAPAPVALVPGAALKGRLSPAPAQYKYWENAKEEVYLGFHRLMQKEREEKQKGAGISIIACGSRRERKVAITFDDGPHPGFTPRLLALLKKHDVKATFFVVGEMAERHPELVKAMSDDGHSVGNHTFHHVKLTRIRKDKVYIEIQACGEAIREITGKTPRLFRPPGGDFNNQVASIAGSLGYVTVLWTDNTHDYLNPGQAEVMERSTRWVENGSILLMHDGSREMMAVLPGIIISLKKKGFRFVTIDEMLEDTAHPRRPVREARQGNQKPCRTKVKS